jgi:hypothetical protein
MTFRPDGSSFKKNHNSYNVVMDHKKLYERPSVAKRGEIAAHAQRLQQRKRILASGLARDKHNSTFAPTSSGLTGMEEQHYEREGGKSRTTYIRNTLRKEDGFTREIVSKRNGGSE